MGRNTSEFPVSRMTSWDNTVSLYLLSDLVEHSDVGEHVVEVVGIRRVILVVPLLRTLHVDPQWLVARLRLVVHAVKPDHVLQPYLVILKCSPYLKSTVFPFIIFLNIIILVYSQLNPKLSPRNPEPNIIRSTKIWLHWYSENFCLPFGLHGAEDI